ncbi:hypothetical protein ILUMI_12254 [Ignelater luminosus]|uniref:Uncharacterized protein n=1 Tax=Ignelater luminosus TaxID=2038154 RepID=A0A8K0CUN0_IGNLU|nr:hypothetical protein ILUMI_12254 [Ignelater luminosus]
MVQNRKGPRNIETFGKEIIKQTVLKVVNKNVPIRKAAVDAILISMPLKQYVDKYRNMSEEKREFLRFVPNYEYDASQTNTERDAMKLGYEIAKRNSLECPLSWGQNEQAGEEWLGCSLSRYPCLSIRKPKATSLGRAISFFLKCISKLLTGAPPGTTSTAIKIAGLMVTFSSISLILSAFC